MMKAPLFLLTFVSLTTAFDIGRPAVHPQLKKFAQDYLGKLVNLRLDFGKTTNQNRLSLQGPTVKFLDNGTNGKDLEVVKQGFVIDVNGMRDIIFKEGHWQMTWNDGSNSGRVICEFDLPEPIQRNDVKIPACHVHLVFPVWTKESLVMDQAIKKKITQEQKELLAEKQDYLAKMQASPNPLRKALLYRDAAAAVEKMTFLRPVAYIPDNDSVIELANGLVMSKEGSLYQSKDRPFNFRAKLFGSAVISMVDPATVET